MAIKNIHIYNLHHRYKSVNLVIIQIIKKDLNTRPFFEYYLVPNNLSPASPSPGTIYA